MGLLGEQVRYRFVAGLKILCVEIVDVGKRNFMESLVLDAVK